MQRSILAVLVAVSLSACSSSDNDANSASSDTPLPVLADDVQAGGVVEDDSNEQNTDGAATSESDTAVSDSPVLVVDNSDIAGSTAGSGAGVSEPENDDANSTNPGIGEVGNSAVNDNDANSDDAGIATSDGGETADSGQTGDVGQNSDIAGSATSDGGETADSDQTGDAGQNSDIAGSATSDGGETADSGQTGDAGQNSGIAGSATSDGGESTASDGGQISDDAEVDAGGDSDASGETVTTPPAPPPVEDFVSENNGSSVIRRSTLSASGQQNICTTASDRDDFSDTQVGDFILHNNAWRPGQAAPGYEWEQCITTNTNGAVVGWTYDWGPGVAGLNGNPNPSGDFFVRSYPELIYGVKDEFRTSAPKSVTGLPIVLSELPSITIDYSYDAPQFGDSRVVDASNNSRFPNGTTISGERNVAIESFLYSPDAAGECSEGIVTRNGGSNHEFEIMVWLDSGAERLPAGPSDEVTRNRDPITLDGKEYRVFTKGSDDRYIAFVAQNPQSSGTLHWNDFVDWARTYAHRVGDVFGAASDSVQIQDSWCVANILVGTEIFWGAGNMNVLDWTITQSR